MKLKFPKLRMIWAIIRGRSVIYKAEFIAGMGLRVKTDKSCIVSNNFVGLGITDHKGERIVG